MDLVDSFRLAFDRRLQPDFGLVREAGEAYARLHDLDGVPDMSWSPLEPLQRATSTVIPIEMRIGDSRELMLFHKSFHPPVLTSESLDRWRVSFATGIERDLRLVPRFQHLASPSGVDIRRILAFDQERLMVVTLGVRGQPLGRVLRYATRSARRSEARKLFPMVGKAMKMLELASEGENVPDDHVNDYSVGLAEGRLQAHLSRTEAREAVSRLESLYVAFQGQPRPGAYYAHGDIDASNVLVDGERLNLIDFAWAPRPLGFDIARFLLRVGLESPGLAPWNRHVSQLVLEGYGDEAVIQSPSYALVQILKLAGLMQRYSGAGQRRRFTVTRGILRRTLSQV